MHKSQIIIVKNATVLPHPSESTVVVTFEALKSWLKLGVFIKRLFYYSQSQLLTYRLDALFKPFFTALLLRLLSHGKCDFTDEQGHQQEINLLVLIKFLAQFIKDFIQRPIFLRQIRDEITQLEQLISPNVQSHPQNSSTILNLSRSPLYLRTDLTFGLKAGGSIAHITGVLNNLDVYTAKPIFLTTDTIPTTRSDIETHQLPIGKAFRDFKELPELFLNKIWPKSTDSVLKNRQFSFVYQRYSLNNYVGLKLAGQYNLPLVLEYNGSEIWMSRHWNRPLKYEALSERIELLNLKMADLIVVVSWPMRDGLVERGISSEKILVNPNGVDPEQYSPMVDATEIREQYHLQDSVVIGFVGTFGPWHGAEKLAQAAIELCRGGNPLNLHFLFIGDGLTRPTTEGLMTEAGLDRHCTFTGLVPQHEGPKYYAACDILVSPHVPNPDGTPFFGSPTKLFEYMAMGKVIVASDLDQIGQVLAHDHTAWLVEPGDVKSLALGLQVLTENPRRRQKLGQAARYEVLDKYTWKKHTERIIQALVQRRNADGLRPLKNLSTDP